MAEITAAIVHLESLRSVVNAALWALYRKIEQAQLDAPSIVDPTVTTTTQEIA